MPLELYRRGGELGGKNAAFAYKRELTKQESLQQQQLQQMEQQRMVLQLMGTILQNIRR
jgi:hypothetical protein